jgi:hypothetical protein
MKREKYWRGIYVAQRILKGTKQSQSDGQWAHSPKVGWIMGNSVDQKALSGDKRFLDVVS